MGGQPVGCAISRRDRPSRPCVVAVICLLAATIAAPASASESVGDQSLKSAQVALSVMRLAGSATVAATVAPGEDIVSVPIHYRFTGGLTNVVKNNNYILSVGGSMPAGTPVFGMPMSKPTGVAPHPELTWCAAVAGSTVSAKGWRIVCFPKEWNGVKWIDAGSDLFPATLFIPMGSMPATTPQIEETSVDIPVPLTAAVKFTGWVGDRAGVVIGIRQPDSRTPVGIHVSGEHRVLSLSLGPATDGACHGGIFGGEFALRPGPDGKSAVIEIIKPLGV